MATKVGIPASSGSILGPVNDFDNLAGWIANPPPDRPLAASIGASGQNVCNFYGALPAAALGLFGPSMPVVGLMCKPYFDREGYDQPVEADPPFSGGQCPDVQYGADYQWKTSNLDESGWVTVTGITNFGLGPLYGPISVVGSLNSGGASTFCGLPFQASYELSGGDGVGGVRRGGLILGGTQCASLPPGATVQIRNLVFFRVSGGPDTCGDPPGGGVEPGANPPPLPSPFPPGQEPGVDPDGQPFFFVPPVESPFPGGDPIEVPDPFPPPPQPPGGGPGAPITPGAPEEGTEPEGEAPEGEEIYALVVDLTSVPLHAREIATGLYVSPCRVFLGTAFGLDLDQAGRALRSGQAVFAETDGLTKWRVTASIGFSLRVTPYYREKKK